jgi:hypothetical protein
MGVSPPGSESFRNVASWYLVHPPHTWPLNTCDSQSSNNDKETFSRVVFILGWRHSFKMMQWLLPAASETSVAAANACYGGSSAFFAWKLRWWNNPDFPFISCLLTLSLSDSFWRLKFSIAFESEPLILKDGEINEAKVYTESQERKAFRTNANRAISKARLEVDSKELEMSRKAEEWANAFRRQGKKVREEIEKHTTFSTWTVKPGANRTQWISLFASG